MYVCMYDQIITLRIIIEQSLEWNSSLHINFIDFEKAFDNVDRETLWKILRYHGVPEKLINIIICQYKDSVCRVIHGRGLTELSGLKLAHDRAACYHHSCFYLLLTGSQDKLWMANQQASTGSQEEV